MKALPILKRVKNAVNKACKGESDFVKEYFESIIISTFNTLENDKYDEHTSTENLNYALAINLEDCFSDLLVEAREKAHEREQRKAEEEKERRYMIECGKKEITFYNALVNDWKSSYFNSDFEQIVKWFKIRGCDVNNDTLDEYDTTTPNGEKEHRKQVDILGTFCGFTLQEINGETEIGYIWVFNNYNDELYFDDKGEVQLWQR